MTSTLPMALLIPEAKAILLAGFGYLLFRVTQDSEGLDVAFERLVIAFLALTFYDQFESGLLSFSEALTHQLEQAGGANDLQGYLLKAIRSSTDTAVSHGGLEIVNQVFRTGVWGILTMIVEWVFLLASLITECAQAILWKLLWFLFPLACGLYAFFPRILLNLALYAVELSLWRPVLRLVETITRDVAQTYLNRQESLGLYIVAVELIAILLILSVPTVTHRFLGGAFTGDFGAGSGVMETGKRWVSGIRGSMNGGQG